MFEGLIWIYAALPLVAGATIGSLFALFGWLAPLSIKAEAREHRRAIALRILTGSVIVDISALLFQWGLDATYRTGNRVFGTEASPLLISVASSANALLHVIAFCFVWRDDKPARYVTLGGLSILLIVDVAAEVAFIVAR